jgi:hypothetical protein
MRELLREILQEHLKGAKGLLFELEKYFSRNSLA